MRVIVQHDEAMARRLMHCTNYIEHINPSCTMIDIKKKYLLPLSKMMQYIEPNFKIILQGEEKNDEFMLDNNDIILATIGTKDTNKQITDYYNIVTRTLEKNERAEPALGCQWINCYSKHNEISAVDYIKCISYLKEYSHQSSKPIIIYANIYIPNEVYRYRSLTYKIINSYMSELQGILIIKAIRKDIHRYYTSSKKPFEDYTEHAVYLEESLKNALDGAVSFLNTLPSRHKLKNTCKENRQKNPLYDTLFYSLIDPEQEIYVPLNLGDFKEPADYRALGLEHVPLIGDYGMLYAKKSKFDELSEVIKEQVEHPYFMPIVSFEDCAKEIIDKNFSYSIAPRNLKYKGTGVYIGIVTTDNVDYTHQALRREDRTSWISCIWEQTRANEGTYYLKEDIDAALGSSNPGEIIPLPKEESISTMMLGIAGGISKEPDYKGVAIEAEFVVAKINTAPETLQRIYGGMPNKYAATMADVLIGTLKLINFAKDMKKPLVLCIPFNTNISSHDGTFIYYNMLGLIAQWQYLTIITVAGAEADKMHHYGPGNKAQKSIQVNLRVQKEKQNIIGVIYRGVVNTFEVNLYSPRAIDNQPINLKIPEIIRQNETTIYSNGINYSFSNGSITLLFRLDNPHVGTWRIEIISENIYPTNIWVSQKELNEYATLDPSDAFITVGSIGNSHTVITVGGYDKDNMVVIGNSGRGYATDNRVQPFLITNGKNIVAPFPQDKWIRVTGTLPAASIMLGVVAAVYNKCIDESVVPFPNTVIMKGILLGVLQQLQEIEYPNPSQGYGIYDIQTLNRLLEKVFNL